MRRDERRDLLNAGAEAVGPVGAVASGRCWLATLGEIDASAGLVDCLRKAVVVAVVERKVGSEELELVVGALEREDGKLGGGGVGDCVLDGDPGMGLGRNGQLRGREGTEWIVVDDDFEAAVDEVVGGVGNLGSG